MMLKSEEISLFGNVVEYKGCKYSEVIAVVYYQ